MRSLVVSDLHLGAPAGHDVLRRAEVRGELLAEVARADRVVLLGDVLELRGVPAHDALERARPALQEIGDAAGDAGVVLVPGNHDHQLAADWIERRRRRTPAKPLELEQTWKPAGSDLAAGVASALGGPELTLAYPGMWLRPDVYATHGHYLDCHNSVPAFEALAAAAMARLIGGMPEPAAGPDAYERLLAPLYGFSYQLAQHAPASSRRWGEPGGSVRIWRRLNPHDGRLTLGSVLLGGVLIPGAVAGVNRAGLGPFSAELSPATLRRAALRGMAEVRRRLGVEAPHLVFGHTHRAGPLPGDALADGWALPGGGRLWNSGSWVHEPALIGPDAIGGGHWPGAGVVVEDADPPRFLRLPVASERLPLPPKA